MCKNTNMYNVRVCKKCGINKELSYYYVSSNHKDGLNPVCKQCHSSIYKSYRAKNKDKANARERKYRNKNIDKIKAYRKEYRNNNKDKINNRRLKRDYGISLKQYHEMVEQQKGLCLICENNDQLYIDHCHKTGKVRGLLCSLCNTAIGFLKENKDILNSAILYLEKYKNTLT